MRKQTVPNRSLQRFCRAAALVCIVWPMTAGAQTPTVQKCQIDGRLVYQSSPCPPEPRAAVMVVPQAAAASAAPKKRTLAEILSERAAAERAEPPEVQALGDGANVLRARMGAR